MGEIDLADRAFCNRCSILVELDQGADQIPKLKEILLSSSDTRNRFLAAYCTGVAYFISDDLERAQTLRPARHRPRPRARRPEPRSTAASTSSAPWPPAHRVSTRPKRPSAAASKPTAGADGYQRVMAAQVEDNLGYVMMCTDRLDEGIGHCEEARAVLEELGANHYLYETLQDLCYGYVLADDLDSALRVRHRAPSNWPSNTRTSRSPRTVCFF